MNNNYIDCTYLALELTKLCIGENNSRAEIMDIYQKNLTDLTGIDYLADIPDIINENKKLKEENMKLALVEESTITKDEIVRLAEYIDEHSGDMEPYIHNTLCAVLKKYIL